jgi:hypothetical protein
VHTYGAESDLTKENKCKKIVYKQNCLKHFYEPSKHPDVVVLGLNLFVRDFFDAVDNFLADVEVDDNLRKRVDGRLPQLFHIQRSKQHNTLK